MTYENIQLSPPKGPVKIFFNFKVGLVLNTFLRRPIGKCVSYMNSCRENELELTY